MKSKQTHKFLSGAIAVFSALAIASTVGCGDNGSSDEQSSEESKAVKATEEISEESSEVETKEESEPETKTEAEESETEESETEEAEEPEEAEEETEAEAPKGDGSISIVSHALSKDNDGNDVLVLEYSWTNTNDEAESFIFAVYEKVYQNGVECPYTYSCDDVDSDVVWEEIQSGDTINVKMAYVLQDKTDVNVTAGEHVGENGLLDETIELGGGKGVSPSDTKETSVKITDHYVTKNEDDEDILIIEFELYNGESEAISMDNQCDGVIIQNGIECDGYTYGDEAIPVEDTDELYVKPGYAVKVYVGVEIADMSDVSVEITDWSGDTMYLYETLSLS
ncbi:MAG: DUF5067 domain-containing protein [Ruminococcus sp.]|nr:DUF5067 domain-containing protein [Ruminococcus sp.]